MGEVSYLPLIEDMVWSYSRIESFHSCKYKFFLKYISQCEEEDKFYATYGSFIHKLIERFYRGGLPKEKMFTEFLTGFSENVKGTRPKQETVQKYIQCGVEYLKGFQPFPYTFLDVEKRVDFEIDGLRFVGFIDFLGRDSDGSLVIVDNKSRDLKPRSGKAKPVVKDKELDAMLRQLYIYSAAIKREFGEYPKWLCFNCFRTGMFIKEPFSEESYNEAIDWAKQEIEEIKATEDFYPTIDPFYCTYICGVSEDCVYNQMTKGRRRGR